MPSTDVPPLSGINVLEVAVGDTAAATGSLLADWGAEVFKVSATGKGRGLERGKAIAAIDLAGEADQAMLEGLLDWADVLLTDLTPAVSARAGLDVMNVRAKHPRVIYARASGLGCEGPDAERAAPGYTAYWSRGGLATTFQLIDHGLTEPAREPVAGFGERPAAAILAGGIAAAIFRRAVSGEAGEVDLSLLGFAAFNLSMDVVSTAGGGATTTGTRLLPPDRFNVLNPLTNFYRTSDGRFIALCVLQERFFESVCVTLGLPEVIDDDRFSTAAARVENARDLVARLDEVFATATLAEWAAHLADVEWVWEPVQTAAEFVVDPQTVANGSVTRDEAGRVAVAGPVQFDERPPGLRIGNREVRAGDLLADRRQS